MTTDEVAFWSMIGSWVSGAATFLAVLASLHIANRKPKTSLTCKVGERIIFGKNLLGENLQESGLGITVVNQSTVPVKIVSIGWRLSKHKYFYQILGDHHSDAVPKRIEYGEQAFFWIKMDDNDWLERFANDFKKHNGKLKHLRCAVNLSTGKSFYIKPESAFLKKLQAMM